MCDKRFDIDKNPDIVPQPATSDERTDSRTLVLVQGALVIAQAIIAEASVSLLALGRQPPVASWGSLLHAAQRFLRRTRRFRIARTSASGE